MLFKNVITEEQVNVSNLTMKEGRIFFSVRGKGCGNRFFNRNTCLVLDEEAENGTFLKCADNWELVQGAKREHKPKQPQPQANNEANEPAKVEKKVEHKPQPQAAATDEEALINAIKNLRGNAGINADEVRAIIREELENLAANEPAKAARIKLALPANKDENRGLIDMVKAMVVNDRVIGRYPWLYGPAGSGKSTMAKQIADELNLPYYSVSSLQQKYELEGYTDAAGELVKTSFYHAFKNGGIFCFDEASTSSAEVQVAFNTAAAQLIYNFPKDGMIQAHPDFHIIAADNSMGRGGDRKYSARYKLDVSTLDRYTFVEVDYSAAHDLNMACGDKELVTFIKAMRNVLDEANTEYIASPRASKAIKAMQEMGMNDKDSLWYGLCSGWKKQDIRTFAARLNGHNKYFSAFSQIADNF